MEKPPLKDSGTFSVGTIRYPDISPARTGPPPALRSPIIASPIASPIRK